MNKAKEEIQQLQQNLKELEKENKSLEAEKQDIINKLQAEKENTERVLKENEDLKSQIIITSVRLLNFLFDIRLN